MQRDLDLIRSLLLGIEAQGRGVAASGWQSSSETDGQSTESIHYHVQLLNDAGLVVADEIVPGQWWPERITWAGHEFLDLARDEELWRSVSVEIEARVGSAPFSVVREVLERRMRDRLKPTRTRRK